MIIIYNEKGQEMAMFKGNTITKYKMISKESRLEIHKIENISRTEVIASYPSTFYGEIVGENMKVK